MPSNAVPTLEDEIVAYLEAGRVRLLETALATGRPVAEPTVRVEPVLIETLVSFRHVVVTEVRPAVSLDYFRTDHEQGAGSVLRSIADGLAGKLAAAYGERCWAHFQESSQKAFDADRGAWIRDVLLRRSLYLYAGSLASLKLPDPVAAKRIAAELLAVCEASVTVDLTIHPVSGVSVKTPLTVCWLTARPLTTHEEAELMASLAPLVEGTLSTGAFGRGLERCVLEVRATRSKGAKPDGSAQGRYHATVVALELLGFDPASTLMAEIQVEPRLARFDLGGRSGFRPNMLQMGMYRELTQADLSSVVALADKIIRAQQAQSSARCLHRFAMAAAQIAPAEQVIDYMIALESFLTPSEDDKYKGEVSFRFATHGAWLLESDPSKRVAMFRRLRGLYNMRSLLVHGSDVPAMTLEADAKGARDLCARAIVYGLNEGWPTAETYRRLCLGARSMSD